MNELQDLGITLNSHPAWPSAPPASCGQTQVQILYPATTLAGVLDLSKDTASWVIEAAKKLEKLGRLRAGWDSYGGVPLKPGAKGLTVRVLDWLRTDELPVPAVVLGSGGTVQLEWRAKGKELEVELRDNSTIEYVKVSTSGDIEEGEATADLSGRLHDLSRWLLR
jgi:hypothetical protein